MSDRQPEKQSEDSSLQERKRIEEQLLTEGRMNQAILENVVEGIITIDANGIIQSFNSAAERIFGYSATEAVGENVSLLMPQPERGQHDQYLRHYVETGEARIIGIGRELVGRRRDGTTFPMHLGVGEVTSDKQRVFVGSVPDLTESRQLQEELANARSLPAVGEMAASMAHQVKNPLAAISGVIDVLEESFVDEGPYHQVFKELSERVHRLDDTIKRLLEFSKPLVAETHPHDLYEMLESIVLSLQVEEPFSAMAFQLGERSHVRVPFDAVLFEQVLRNLLDNAAQAMPDGGEIRLELSEDADSACLRITDTGHGVPPDALKKLGQPFFTTRTAGTGLGLAMCKKIMAAHGGSIAFSSEPGNGTSVTLCLPKQIPDQ